MSGDEVVRLAADLRTALSRSRRAETSRGYTLVGPHRHDVAITLQGVSARDLLSAGQTKLLATALKLAAQGVIERILGCASLVIFDDVDAELDSDVLARLLSRLARCEQVVMSSAHGETILPRLPRASVWRLSNGQISEVDGVRSVD
jgi:DNA replication and repair protein RecF